MGISEKRITFMAIPDTLEEFKALPQAEMKSPFDTAALTVVALSIYPKDSELSLVMLDYLKGPKPLTPMEKQFIRDRIAYQSFVPKSFFDGATPHNDYTPVVPYMIKVSENPYSYNEQGYARLFLTSGGADSPRGVTLRQAKDGKWYLWDQTLLAGIREPESLDPWV